MRTFCHTLPALFILTFPLWFGCATTRVVENTRVPEITITASDTIRFKDQPVIPSRLAAALRSAGIRNDQEVNILIPDHPNQALMRTVSAALLRGGYTRMVFVTDRKASSALPGAATKR